MSSPRRRIETDVMKLMSDYEVTLVNDNMYAPAPMTFPLGIFDLQGTGKSFMSVLRVLKKPHSKADSGRSTSSYQTNTPIRAQALASSGSVCLDVINQTWSPMFDMINIFEVFLPQLLRYPNPTDPLNGEAASLLMREPKTYEAKVKEYVSKYATREAIDDNGAESDDDDDMSSVASFGSDDNEEAAGTMEEL
ncbi:hypothetical protein V497_02525 [Pseudogymnoascus sp. VKM F-4516 (FW-969)]|nr:hypothetical protein V497_02525 [Pseudogymnoascus sp. VKM F-4516 (FW-969)]